MSVSNPTNLVTKDESDKSTTNTSNLHHRSNVSNLRSEIFLAERR